MALNLIQKNIKKYILLQKRSDWKLIKYKQFWCQILQTLLKIVTHHLQTITIVITIITAIVIHLIINNNIINILYNIYMSLF